MNIITLDAETHYSDDYTLKKQTTESYIRDPRFQTLLWAVKLDDAPAQWVSAERLRTNPELRYAIENSAVLCHHAHFDGLILSHHFSLKPKAWLDTYSMARYLLGPDHPLSLKALAEKYALPPKTIDYDDFKGRRLGDFTPDQLARLGSGAARDADTTYDLFMAMSAKFPAIEYPIIDTTVRMFTEPRLVGDAGLFATVRDREFMSKNERMYELGVGEKDLQSATKFCALLEAEGVEIKYKDGSKGPIPAIAKTDSFMRRLAESDDERVAALANARLEVRSTLAETRAGRLHDMAGRGSLAVYLYYCGAHTRRWSGGDAVNLQNLTKGSDLRRGIRAPEGYALAAPDQSQGECRIVNWLAGQEDVVERFRRKEDPYLPMASRYHGREIVKGDKERQDGKVIELACGFGMGGPRLTAKAKNDGVVVDGDKGVKLYRDSHKMVVAYWKQADWVIESLARKADFTWSIFTGRDGILHHPNGTWLNYTGLRWRTWFENERKVSGWTLDGRRGGWSKAYGAKLVENVVQWCSRIVTCEAMARFKAAGVPIVGMAHDDVWLLVPRVDNVDQRAELQRKICAMMSVTPDWAPGLPLAADCKIGETYS